MHQGVLRAANVKLPHFDMPSPWFTPTVVTSSDYQGMWPGH